MAEKFDSIPPAWSRADANALVKYGLEKGYNFVIRENGGYFEAIYGFGSIQSGLLAFGGADDEGGVSGLDKKAVTQAAITALASGLILSKVSIPAGLTLKSTVIIEEHIGETINWYRDGMPVATVFETLEKDLLLFFPFERQHHIIYKTHQPDLSKNHFIATWNCAVSTGKIDYCCNFGTEEYHNTKRVELAFDALFDNFNTDFTLCTWIKLVDLTRNACIVSRANGLACTWSWEIEKTTGLPVLKTGWAHDMEESIVQATHKGSESSIVTDGTFIYMGALSATELWRVNISTLAASFTTTSYNIIDLAMNAAQTKILTVNASGAPARICRVDVATFTEDGTVSLGTGENIGTFLCIEGNYLYVSCSTSPAKLVKVDWTTMTRIGVITAPTGQDYGAGVTSDGTHLYWLVGSYGDTAILKKIDISTFSIVDSITTSFKCGRGIKIWGDYLVIASRDTMDSIRKVKISTFTEDTYINTYTNGNIELCRFCIYDDKVWIPFYNGTGVQIGIVDLVNDKLMYVIRIENAYSDNLVTNASFAVNDQIWFSTITQGAFPVQDFVMVYGYPDFFYDKQGWGVEEKVGKAVTGLTANIWYHIAVTFSSQRAKFYLNGKLDSEVFPLPVGQEYTIEDMSIGIGYKNKSLSQVLRGFLDETYVFKRALSAEEIKRIFYASAHSPALNDEIEWRSKENRGEATIIIGNTQVTVDHLLYPLVPEIRKIRLIPKVNLGGRSFYASNVTSSQFKINISSAHTIDSIFSWEIVR